MDSTDIAQVVEIAWQRDRTRQAAEAAKIAARLATR